MNNSTIFALIFHILAPPRPLSTRLGAFSSPVTFSRKNFPKFFPPKGKLTFFCIFGAKNYEGERLLSLRNRGGVSSLGVPIYSRLPFHPLFLSFPFHQGKKHQKQGKIGQKLYFIWWSLVFSRDFRRPKGAKLNIYLIFEDCRGFRCGSLFGAVVVSTGGSWSGNSCYFANVSKIGQDTAGYSAFCPLYRFALVGLPANMALFRILRAFLEGFGFVVYVCITLMLCVYCGAFVCVNS